MNINQGKGYRIFSVFNILLMILICLMIIFPLYYMLIVSISDGAAIMSGQVNFLPVGFSLRAYRAAFKDANFIKSYWNTVVITACGTTVNLLMTTLFAYPLSRSDLMGRKLLMKIAVFTMFFTGGMIPSYMLVNSLGMNNTYWALILPGAINVYNATIMRTFFEGIPMDMTEAAYVDGANDVRILWQVILPLSKPILFTLLLFYAVGHWNGFFSALLYLSDKSTYPRGFRPAGAHHLGRAGRHADQAVRNVRHGGLGRPRHGPHHRRSGLQLAGQLRRSLHL